MKNRTKIYFMYLVCVLALTHQACQDPPLPPVVGEEPFFKLDILVDGDSANLAAGVNDYYLFTRFEQNEEGLYFFEGELKPANCQNCGPQLSIRFRHNRLQAMGELPDLDSIVAVKSYAFFGSQKDTLAYETRFTALIANPQNYVFNWDLGDGNSSSAASFTHRYANFPAQYPVELSISNASCSSKLTQLVDVPKASCFPNFSYEPLPLGGFSNLNFEIIAQNGFSYAWDFGDGNRATGERVSHNFNGRGAYQVCLLADGPGCRASNCRNITVGEVGGCAINFAYQSNSVISIDSLELGVVEIVWVDENGIQFRSRGRVQPNESFFQVNKVDAYQENESGFPTFAYDFSMKCRLQADGEEILLEIPMGKMAVAYPK